VRPPWAPQTLRGCAYFFLQGNKLYNFGRKMPPSTYNLLDVINILFCFHHLYFLTDRFRVTNIVCINCTPCTTYRICFFQKVIDLFCTGHRHIPTSIALVKRNKIFDGEICHSFIAVYPLSPTISIFG